MPRYLPPLSVLLSVDNLPANLGFVEDGLNSVFSKLYFKNFHVDSSIHNEEAYYTITIVSKTRLAFSIGEVEGFNLILNPDFTDGNTIEFPMSISYHLPILKYIDDFNSTNFDFSFSSIYNLLLEIGDVDEVQLISGLAYNIYGEYGEEDEQNPFQVFIDDFNTKNNPVSPIQFNDLGDQISNIEDILNQLKSNGNDFDIFDIVFNDYLSADDDFGNVKTKIEKLFSDILGNFDLDNLSSFLIPKFSASLNSLSLSIEFPRTWLKPVDSKTFDVIEDGNVKSQLRYNASSLSFSTEKGFEFDQTDSLELTPSQIGNTGILIEFDNLKIDLSKNSNIPEAIIDGRADDFMGVYAQTATITLPKKWFRDHPDSTSTAKVVGTNILIGTGGVSGTIALEAVDNTTEGILWKKLGENGFAVGFKSFDITFKQNTVVDSNIIGQLRIPRLKDAKGNDAEVEITGHLDAEGDFLLTASEKDGFAPIVIPDVLEMTILSLELGKQDDEFFIGTSCKIKFTNAIMTKLLGDQAIEIPKLRIYSDGSFEIVSGTIPVPANFNLNLGPVEIGISGVNFSSYQQEYQGKMRKYYCFGFDGSINLGPLGVEARGKGMQYYFTVDNNEDVPQNNSDYKPKHSYFRIQTIEADIIVPGDAKPENATAIINGYLSIPKPGESKEYEGRISLKLPKAKIAGSAEMRLTPKFPAFIIDASIELPKPIPLGATGLGIFGFRGLFGYRYVAEKDVVNADTWYEYYKAPKRGVNIQKFRTPQDTDAYTNPVSIGAGASLATTFDDGKVISTRLFLLLSIPSLFLLEGKANILSKRIGLDDRKEPPFFAFIAYGDRSIELGLGADYKLPKKNGRIFSSYANVQAGFFFDNPSAWYVNFGTDKKPIESKIISILRAKSYLMLSAKGIRAGAKTEFIFDKKFGPARVKAWLYAEVGGHISFEKPQMGGYLAAGGGLEVKVWFISVGISFDAIFSAEAAEPFLIYASFRVCGKIKIGFVKIRKCAEVELKWEKSKRIDRTPIQPLLKEKANEQIKGVNMISGETFDLVNLGNTISSGTPNISGDHQLFNKAILPLDTFIDIKFTKNVLPKAVSKRIGGNTNAPKGYEDLIPPEKTVKGGKKLRQVTHRYSIENIGIKAWNGSAWKEYHPYEALISKNNENTKNLKIGHWQKSGKEYNAVRLLADSPFSYTSQGEKGWFIPEQVGITANIFCEEKIRNRRCVNWLDNRKVGRLYHIGYGFFQKGFYFNLTGRQGNHAMITARKNPFGYDRSLLFQNNDILTIELDEDASSVKLKLTTDAKGVTIRYFKGIINDDIEIQYKLVEEVYKTQQELLNEVVYENEDEPILKVVVAPDRIDQDQVKSIKEQIAKLFEDTYQDAITNGNQGNIDVPNDVTTYNRLLQQLETLKKRGCSTIETDIGQEKIKVQVKPFYDNPEIKYEYSFLDFDCEEIAHSIRPLDHFEDIEAEVKKIVDIAKNSPEKIVVNENDRRYVFEVLDESDAILVSSVEHTSPQACRDQANKFIELLYKYLVKISEEPCESGNTKASYFLSQLKTDRGLRVLGLYEASKDKAIYAVGEIADKAILLKLDYSGTIIWQNTLDAIDSLSEVMEAHEDGVICKNYEVDNLVLSKVGSGGEVLWTKEYIPEDQTKSLGGQVIKLSNKRYAILNKGYKNNNTSVVKTVISILDLEGAPITEREVLGISVHSILAVQEDILIVGTIDNQPHLIRVNQSFDIRKSITIKHKGDPSVTLSIRKVIYHNETIYISGKGYISDHSYYPFMASVSEGEFAQGTSITVKLFSTRYNLDFNLNNEAIYVYYFGSHDDGSFYNTIIKCDYDFNVLWVKSLKDNKDIEFSDISEEGILVHSSYNGSLIGRLDLELDSCITIDSSIDTLSGDIDFLQGDTVTFENHFSAITTLEKATTPTGLSIEEICPGHFNPPVVRTFCSTMLHEVCWQTVRDITFNNNINLQKDIQEDYKATVDAILNNVAPIWRPNTSYYLYFQLKDTVDGGNDQGIYDYYYGFKTAGPVGHYHNAGGVTFGERDGDKKLINPDQYPLTSIRNYIDYNRSYPNADGNLLRAKPLFYSSEDNNNEILLFFSKSYALHMFSQWPEYNGMPALKGDMKIVVKDPKEDITIENPPPPDVTTTEVPRTVESWTEDDGVLLPEHLKLINNLIQAHNDVDPDFNCLLTGGELIKPKSFVRTVTVNHLKPLKMYTAIVNNIFEGKAVEVHNFFFQTSRYANFKEQVKSYLLEYPDENSSKAVFDISVNITAEQTKTAFEMVNRNYAVGPENLKLQYTDLFERVVEGLLDLKPLDPPLGTEFNLIKSVGSGDIVAIWIRNPEPYNDPKIPFDTIKNTIAIMNQSEIDTNYTTLFSKDYSQAFIMHSNHKIEASSLDFEFKYLRWDGKAYEPKTTIPVTITIQ